MHHSEPHHHRQCARQHSRWCTLPPTSLRSCVNNAALHGSGGKHRPSSRHASQHNTHGAGPLVLTDFRVCSMLLIALHCRLLRCAVMRWPELSCLVPFSSTTVCMLTWGSSYLQMQPHIASTAWGEGRTHPAGRCPAGVPSQTSSSARRYASCTRRRPARAGARFASRGTRDSWNGPRGTG